MNGESRQCFGSRRFPRHSGTAGFSLIELVIVLAISIIICAFALPNFQNTMLGYRLTSATSSLVGAIQGARYQAVSVGCPYQLALTSTTTTYQLSAESITGTPPACGTSYSNVGSAIPWTSTSNVTLNTSVTLTFNPNGTVTSTQAGAPPTTFTLTAGGVTKTITVSGVGYVTVQSQ